MRRGPRPEELGPLDGQWNPINAMKDTRCIYVASKHDVFVETTSRIQFTPFLSIFTLDTTSTPKYDAVMPLRIVNMTIWTMTRMVWGPKSFGGFA